VNVSHLLLTAGLDTWTAVLAALLTSLVFRVYEGEAS